MLERADEWKVIGRVLDSEETRSAIKMIKRMGRERVEKSGKHKGMGEREQGLSGCRQ